MIIYINNVQIDLAKMTLREASIRSGVNVDTIKRMIKLKREDEKLKRAKRDIADKTVGWNPFSGSKKGLRN